MAYNLLLTGVIKTSLNLTPTKRNCSVDHMRKTLQSVTSFENTGSHMFTEVKLQRA